MSGSVCSSRSVSLSRFVSAFRSLSLPESRSLFRSAFPSLFPFQTASVSVSVSTVASRLCRSFCFGLCLRFGLRLSFENLEFFLNLPGVVAAVFCADRQGISARLRSRVVLHGVNICRETLCRPALLSLRSASAHLHRHAGTGQVPPRRLRLASG